MMKKRLLFNFERGNFDFGRRLVYYARHIAIGAVTRSCKSPHMRRCEFRNSGKFRVQMRYTVRIAE